MHKYKNVATWHFMGLIVKDCACISVIFQNIELFAEEKASVVETDLNSVWRNSSTVMELRTAKMGVMNPTHAF